MSIVGSADKVTHTEADIRAALRRAMGRDFDYEILSVLRWVRRELVADRYGTRPRLHRRRRRPPDVADRRLRHEHRHPGCGRSRLEARGGGARLGRPSDLLRSYEVERRPVAIRNVTEAERQSRPHALHAASAGRRRKSSSRARRATPRARSTAPGSPRRCGTSGSRIGFHLGYRYDTSPIVWPDGTSAPPLDDRTYTQTARPGARAPHAWLPDGRSTLDLFGRGFTLLRAGRGCAANGEACAPRRRSRRAAATWSSSTRPT